MISLVGGASTQSRGRRPLPKGAKWAQTQKTYGPYEWVATDAGVKMYLSWVIGQSGLLWGGGPFPDVIKETCQTMVGDMSGAYGHWNEDELCKAFDRLRSWPRPMSARFFQSGGEALAAAARVARRATGRTLIASYGYHGAAAEYVHPPVLGGVPLEFARVHAQFEWGDVDGMRRLAARAAAVVVEVPGLDDEDGIRKFLAKCRKACDEQGIPLILDEVVTGFRVALGGAIERYDVEPDIVCYGKAMSATGCISATVGREDMMKHLGEDTFYSTTFGGSPRACAISTATINYLIDNRQEIYLHLDAIGGMLKEGLIGLGIDCRGQNERFAAFFPNEEVRREWCSRMIAEGIIVDRPFFTTLAHGRVEVEKTLEAARRTL